MLSLFDAEPSEVSLSTIWLRLNKKQGNGRGEREEGGMDPRNLFNLQKAQPL